MVRQRDPSCEENSVAISEEEPSTGHVVRHSLRSAISEITRVLNGSSSFASCRDEEYAAVTSASSARSMIGISLRAGELLSLRDANKSRVVVRCASRSAALMC